MITQAGSRQFQAEWFNHVGNAALPYAVPKTEYQDLFRQTVEAVQNQAKQNYADLTQRVQAGGTRVKLTEEQKEYLSEHFDPRNMSRADYQKFIDKLCEYGVLDEADKPYINYGLAGSELEAIPLSAINCEAYIMTADSDNLLCYTNSFSMFKSNVLEWSGYLSGIRALEQNTGIWQKKPEAVLFGKIHNVLEAISG